MANGLFDTDYSFLGLPEVGSAVGKPINISQAAINEQLGAIDEVTVSKQQLQEQLQLALLDNDFNKIKSLQDQIAVLDAREMDLLTYLDEPTDIQNSLASINSEEPVSIINEPVPEEVLTAGTPSPPEILPVFPTIESPTPIREEPVRVTPFAPEITNRFSNPIANPTASMTSRSMGLDSPIAISGGMPISSSGGDGISLGGLGSLAKTIGSGVEKAANLGLFGFQGQILSKIGRAVLNKINPPTEGSTFDSSLESIAGGGGAKGRDATADAAASRIAATIANLSTPEDKATGATQAAAILNARLASGDADTKTAIANLVRNAKADARAAANAADTAGMQRDKASAMNVLYGGAGSSKESSRDAYTESGQAEIDREARQAAFDAMRAASGQSVKRTPAETARMLADLQSRIGFGGAMSPANAPFSTIPERVAPPNVEYDLVSGFNVPNPRQIASAINNQGIAPFMGVPGSVMRSRGARR